MDFKNQLATSNAGLHNRRFGEWLVRELEVWFATFLALDDGLPLVLALWTLHTYLFRVFDATPYLLIWSPVKRCGKTLLLSLLDLLCARSRMLVNITGPTLFRLVERHRPTLLIDECEALRMSSHQRVQDLREVILAGYKPGAKVPRVNGGQVEEYDVFCPKALCVIREVPEVLLDRCIPISMRRRKSDELVQRFHRRRLEPVAGLLAKSIQAWAADQAEEVLRAEEQLVLDDLMNDRDEEVWRPLFSIATVAVPHRLPDLREVARSLCRQKERLDAHDALLVRLLTDIRIVIADEPGNAVWSESLMGELKALPESTWGELTASRLATMLRPFGIEPSQVWVKGHNRRGYNLDKLREVCERYLGLAAGAEATD